jgi:sigma-B regulation protein RsbU (phosphoserine phosphatase)
MHWQAGLFGRATHSMVLRNQLTEALRRIDREVQIVGEIQRSLLPGELPSLPGFELAAYYQTSARAGGDYYDFFPLANNGCGLFIADVSGHGTPAAVLMAITHAIAHTQPGGHKPPAEVLAHLNRHLTLSYTRSSTFVTAFYATLDPASRRLTYSIAGHNPPRLLRDGKVLPLDKCAALPLGIMEDQAFEEASLTLQPHDLLLLYTDGITESFAPGPPGQARDMYGVPRLDALLQACGSCPPQEYIDRIRASVAEFTGNAPPTDDQTLVALKCL